MGHRTRTYSVSFRKNARSAQSLWTDLSTNALAQLKELTRKYHLSIISGDLCLLDGKWYVTHSGLLALAQRRRCKGIRTSVEAALSDPNSRRWVCKATAYRGPSARFVAYGDADPSNVSPLVRGAEMRVAETRAVNRALWKAYGIGLCSVEELGSFAQRRDETTNGKPHRFLSSNGNGSANGTPKLRDRLCLLIRKYGLDSAQVKRYAADFCGTEVLRDASRDLVESFIATLEQQATSNRDALICKLNSYPSQPEVHA